MIAGLQQVLSNQQCIMQALLAILENDGESGRQHVARNLRTNLVKTLKLLGRWPDDN